MLTKEEIHTVITTRKPIFKASLDKLTILGDDTGNFETMVNNNNYGFIEGSGLAKHPYKKNFYCLDGSVLQWTDSTDMKAIRYEFNPNKVIGSETHERAVADILNTMKYPKVSRFDYAIDVYGVDLSTYTIVDRLGVKKNYWVNGSNQIETIYVGAPTSDTRIRIYNKKVEQKLTKDLPVDWWRIEVQYRDTACLSLEGLIKVQGVTDSDGNSVYNTVLPYISNPFEHIKLFKPNYRSLTNIKEMAMCKLLIEEPEMLAQLSVNSRTKYKKILASLPTEKDLEIETLFSSYSAQILKDIFKWLDIPKRNDVLGRYKPNNKRSQKELQESLMQMKNEKPSELEKEFLIESAKIHMLYNT